METILLGIFLFGLVFVVLSFVLGFAQAELPIPGLSDLELGEGGADGGPSPANVGTLLAFATWFGGVGWLLARAGWELPAVLAGALVSGVAGGTVVFLTLARVLYAGQTPLMRPEDYRLEGTLGRVSLPMDGGRIGEIVYTKHGTTRSEGARSADGAPLPRGTEVVVLRYERGVAYVEALDKLLAQRASEPQLPDGRREPL